MSELTHDQLRRVLAATEFEYTDELFWRYENGTLTIYAKCSDFFAWGCADMEPIETEADVELLERSLTDLRAAANDQWPPWLTELYAARRRRALAAPFMFSGKYAIDASVQDLFREAAAQQEAVPA